MRHGHGGAGAEADDLDRRHLVTNSFQDVLDPIIGEKEGISPRKKDVADLGPRLQIGETGLELVVSDRRGSLTDLPLSGAMPTQHGALVHDDPQHPIGIAVSHSRRHRITVFVEGILDVEIRETELAVPRYGLQADRALRIVGIDERCAVRRYRESEPLQRPFDGRKILYLWEVIEKDMFQHSKVESMMVPMANGGVCHG